MHSKVIRIALLRYPQSYNSAVYGLEEMFHLANSVCVAQGVNVIFEPSVVDLTELSQRSEETFSVAILTPTSNESDYLDPAQSLISWVKAQYQSGAILASACCSSFVLAQAGVLDGKSCTTHWKLEETFKSNFPNIELRIQDILRNEGDVITAGGMMSWLDLGFEIITQYTKLSVLRDLGRLLVMDTTPREQCYYRKFTPNRQHNDEVILSLQNYLNTYYSKPFSIGLLLEQSHLSERTLQRRFINATGLTPSRYIQRLRVQKACDLLESTSQPFESIVYQVGYRDAGAFRKLFREEMGLSPKKFRERFSVLSTS